MFHISKKIDNLYQKGNWDEIIRIGEKLLLQGTEDVKILNDLAVAYRRKNMLEESFKVCDKIYFINPISDILKQSVNLGTRYMRYHQIMGEILYKKGEYEKALKIFESLKSLGSHFSEKFFLSAKIYTKQKKYDLALSEYQSLIKKCPHRTEDAVEGLLELVKADPANEKVYSLLFEAYDKDGILKKELMLYEQAVKKKKDIFDVYITGNFYRCSNQIDKAIALFSEYNGSDPVIPLFLGNMYLARNDHSGAVAEYKLFFERNPEKRNIALACFEKVLNMVKNDEMLLRYTADLYLEDGNFDAAEEKIRLLKNLKPENTEYQAKLEDILLKIADYSFMEGNLEIAEIKLKSLTELKPDKSEYRKRLKDIESFALQNKISEYEEKLKQEDLSGEEVNMLRFELAELYLRKDADEQNAVSLFQKVAKSESQYKPEALCRAGIFFLSKGMIELADENFRKIRELDIPEDKKAEILYRFGNAYEEKGIFESAREIYRQILFHDIKYRDVAQRMERLPANIPDNKKNKDISGLEDRYDHIERIGEGGMGAIYKAKDKLLGRVVALKVIRTDFRSDTETVQRFIREAQSASALQHPGIVTIFDIQVKEPMYIVMEFIDGGNLRKKLNRSALQVPHFLKFAIDICEAIGAAHAKEIIHRDIKPENIMLTREENIKITDFGLASINNATRMTMVGQILGTPLYMSPEQIIGKSADNRSDIYSLGITFYEMLTGKVPFSDGDIGYRHIHENPEPPSLLNPAVSDHLEKVILKSIEKKSEKRYQGVIEVLEELKKIHP